MDGSKGEQSLLFLLEIARWPRWGLGFVLIPGGYLASEESVDPIEARRLGQRELPLQGFC